MRKNTTQTGRHGGIWFRRWYKQNSKFRVRPDAIISRALKHEIADILDTVVSKMWMCGIKYGVHPTKSFCPWGVGTLPKLYLEGQPVESET
jgi:hypothetical protein